MNFVAVASPLNDVDAANIENVPNFRTVSMVDDVECVERAETDMPSKTMR